MGDVNKKLSMLDEREVVNEVNHHAHLREFKSFITFMFMNLKVEPFTLFYVKVLFS